MLLRIALILAILAGAGVIAITQLKVRPHIQGIIDEREKNAQDRDREKGGRLKAEASLKETQGKLAETETKLKDTETQLASTKTQLDSEQKRANDLKQNLDKTSQDLKNVQAELAAWKNLGIPVEQVAALRDSEKKLRDTNAVLEAEKNVMGREIKRLTNLVAKLTGSDIEPPLPAGLKGKVLVVDPKWDFVVLDIGEEQGVVQNGVMMVSRDSKLVGKVKIVTVQAKRSIANIVPGWKLTEVMEGDQVIY